jgi:hypothetical protein
MVAEINIGLYVQIAKGLNKRIKYNLTQLY